MKLHYLTLGCLFGSALVQAAEPEVRPQVVGLTQTSRSTGENETLKEKGMTLEVMCIAGKDRAFANEEDWSRERKEEPSKLVARDSTGADLGMVMLMHHTDQRGVSGTTFFSLRTERLPAGKVEWVEVRGSISCEMLTKPRMSKPAAFECKEGTSLAIDNLSFEFGRFDVSGFAIRMSANKKVAPFELVFTNAKGEPITMDYKVTQRMVIDDQFSIVRHYSWKGMEDKLSLSVRYWNGKKSVNIPVALKAHLVNQP